MPPAYPFAAVTRAIVCYFFQMTGPGVIAHASHPRHHPPPESPLSTHSGMAATVLSLEHKADETDLHQSGMPLMTPRRPALLSVSALLLMLALMCTAHGGESPTAPPDAPANTGAEAPLTFPDTYESMSYAQRIAWLQTARQASTDDAQRYQYGRELAAQHYKQKDRQALKQTCLDTPPEKLDFEYRMVCIDVVKTSHEDAVRLMLAAHEDALAGQNINIATNILMEMAWQQSSAGDIAGAFASYEHALKLAEQAAPEVLNDVMLNTATVYVIHGDSEYVKKGVQLQQATHDRLRAQLQENPDSAPYAVPTLAVTQHNIGVAYALHLYDYAQALHWLAQVDPANTELRRSVLVFSALAAAELQQNDQARQWLAASLQAPKSVAENSDYLFCYQELVRMKLDGAGDLDRCRRLTELTPLEVSVDLYKRMAAMSQPDWRLAGLEKLHRLFTDKLEAQLKQSATRAASHAELSRLQLESKLKDELLEKEQALKRAEQDKRASQTLLAIAGAAILLLIILVITVQLRQNRKLARQYAALSVRDGLTGLNNRRYFEQNIEREINFVRRSQQDGTGHGLALYLFDIDHFKQINDRHGHDAGDEVLIEFARRLADAIRETDMLVRWGGEEFLLVARLEKSGDHQRVAERIRSTIAGAPFVLGNGTALQVTCTIGAIVYPQTSDHSVGRDVGRPVDNDARHDATSNNTIIAWPALVQLADAALYTGKRQHRNCWVSIDDIPDPGQLDSILKQDLVTSEQNRQLLISRSFTVTMSG